MKKSIRIIYIVLFLLICCTPFGLMLILPSPETVGKEEAVEMPCLIEDGKINDEIGSQFDDWFTKSIPLRPEIITVQNEFASGIFGKESNNVITGSDGWIYSSESVDDYIGVRISDRGIHNISETIRIMQDYTEAHGANFVFTAAPNKNQIYPEYMPLGYIKNNDNNLSRLEKYLKCDKINYVSLKDELLKQKDNGNELYLKCDTHWNGLGALYGYNAIMNGLGSEHESFSGLGYTVKNDWYGDISKMLYPSAPKPCSQYYFDMDYSAVRFMQPRASQGNKMLMEDLMSDKEENDVVIRSVNAKGQGSLYISRDSFSRAMLPFLISNYRSAYITRLRSFDLKDIDDKNYTDVVYEMVERKLDSITDIVPMIYAPEVKGIDGKEIRNGGNNIVKQKNEDGSLRVYGLLDSKEISDTARIYIKINDGGKDRYFEAFPDTETELLGLEEKSDYGFSALIEGISGDITEENISVIIK